MTAGKRPRLMMRRTVSVASLGGAGSDHLSDPSPNQQQPHQQPVHQVIGFAPKAFSEGNKFLLQDPTTPMVFGEPSCPSTRSSSGKPFSGLSLLSDSPRDGVDNTKVGLGIVAALENNRDFIGSPPVNSTPVFRSATLTPAPAPAPALAPVAPVAPLVVVVPPTMNSSSGPRYLPPPDIINFTSINRSRQPEPGLCIDQSSKLDRCLLRPSFTTLGFLKSCFLCKRDISHGHDIYMYRGDRAFCSAECRHQQILNDERAERKCSSAALKAAAVAATAAAAANHQHNHHHHHHQQQASRVVHHQRSSKVSTAPATTAAAA